MEERFRDDGFEATFVVSTPRKDAWDRLKSAQPARDWLPKPRDDQWWIPGHESPADELEVVPAELLHVRKATDPCKDTDIVITLEDVDAGTRVTVVQSGFGPGFDDRRAWLASGWYAIVADLVVFLQRGVSPGRHLTWWSNIGCDVRETDEGLVVANVRPEGFAGRAGMRDGDLVLDIAGAPLVDVRDLSILVRGPLVESGTEAKARYLRGDEILTGAGTI